MLKDSHSANPRLRAAAAQALSCGDGEKPMLRLIEMLKDSDECVVQVAARCLANFHDERILTPALETIGRLNDTTFDDMTLPFLLDLVRMNAGEKAIPMLVGVLLNCSQSQMERGLYVLVNAMRAGKGPLPPQNPVSADSLRRWWVEKGKPWYDARHLTTHPARP